jgi:hypothetical protein
MALAMSDGDIETGVNALVTTAKNPIRNFSDDAWAYVLKFTAWHEGVVTCMYNNFPEKTQTNPDVTYGVGTSVRVKADCRFHLQWFFAKGTSFSQPASLAELEADWQKASDMPRGPNTLTDYDKATKLEVVPAKALEGMVLNFKSLVLGRLVHADFADFAKWPVQAQIGLVSYCYGIDPRIAPKMRAALKAKNFDTAGLQSFIGDSKDPTKPGWSNDKILDHRRLFYNAARIMEQNPDLDDPAWKNKMPAKIHGLDLEGSPAGVTPPSPPNLAAP